MSLRTNIYPNAGRRPGSGHSLAHAVWAARSSLKSNVCWLSHLDFQCITDEEQPIQGSFILFLVVPIVP